MLLMENNLIKNPRGKLKLSPSPADRQKVTQYKALLTPFIEELKEYLSSYNNTSSISSTFNGDIDVSIDDTFSQVQQLLDTQKKIIDDLNSQVIALTKELQVKTEVIEILKNIEIKASYTTGNIPQSHNSVIEAQPEVSRPTISTNIIDPSEKESLESFINIKESVGDSSTDTLAIVDKVSKLKNLLNK